MVIVLSLNGKVHTRLYNMNSHMMMMLKSHNSFQREKNKREFGIFEANMEKRE